MLNNINKLGTVLNKEAQKDINGGYGLCAGGPMYAFCPPDSANSQDPCTICVNLF
ncbi:hypothetical protein [Tenacibaculum sp. M341]|uniref:hypothetical protein n=1 Tax=Tenacibaculum sp. M341 TaxID=2530339 RepID=UPI0014046036|nr:hypothetical protein [Tenacibaculum sp. M341]